MAISNDILATWRARQPVAGVNFAHDDLVMLNTGEHAGNVGSLTSIEQVEPEVIYLVEIDTNFVVPAKQSELELAE